MRYYALVFHTESTVKELRKHKGKTIDEWDEESIKYLLNLYKSAKKEVNVSDVLSSQRKRQRAQMLRVRAGTKESVTKTSTFSIPHHAALGLESRAPPALQRKRQDATPVKRSRTAETRELRAIAAGTRSAVNQDLAEHESHEDK
jgi:hypothetical protein